jgi:hypothetical protein
MGGWMCKVTMDIKEAHEMGRPWWRPELMGERSYV